MLTHVPRRDKAVAAMVRPCGPVDGWSWRTRIAPEQEIAEHLANIAAGRIVLAAAPLITASGQRR